MSKMVQVLKKLIKEKKYAQLDFHDGESVVGFITYADKDVVIVKKLDDVGCDKDDDYYDWDDDYTPKTKEQLQSVDMILNESLYQVSMICSVHMDISHTVDPEVWKTLSYMCDNGLVFDELTDKTTTKKKTTKKKPLKKVTKIKDPVELK